MHSFRSDGKESPPCVAGSCRRIGLDFMAVTDHKQYAPSLEARDAFRDIDTDLQIFPGEEIHPPDNPVHIVSFGASSGITELMADTERYRAEVDAVRQQMGELPPGVDSYQYASAVWAFGKIREAGGLAVYAHPYWFTQHTYQPAGPLTTHLFSTQPFDAVEVCGGFHAHELDSNKLQTVRYYEERAQGRTVPIVSVSDAHGCETGSLFGWYYTVVFSVSNTLPDIINGIKDLYSVGVEALPDETVRVHGPFRLVKYTLYLLREVFPEHDELCFEEGRLMLAYLAGDHLAAEQLNMLKGRCAMLYDRYWRGKG